MEIETQSYITNLLKTNPKIVENNLNYNDKKFKWQILKSSKDIKK